MVPVTGQEGDHVGSGYAPCGEVGANVLAPLQAERKPSVQLEDTMIVLGVILLIVGFLTSISILWTIGIILVVIGVILWIVGALGHSVGGRKHYW